MELKEAIETLKVLIGLEEFNKLSYKENKAIDTVLNELEKYQKQLDLDYVDKNFIPREVLQKIVEECIPKKENMFNGELEYSTNANANSFLAQEILKILEDKE